MSDSTGRRLGRGLSALFGGGHEPEHEEHHEPATAADASVPAAAVVEPGTTGTASLTSLLPVAAIQRNPFQPRREFEEAALNELAESICQHGLLQPVLVRPVEGGWQLVAGERRWLAAQRLGLTEIPCCVMSLEDREVAEAALEENLKRKDLNPLEKAQAFQDYVQRNGCTIEELGKRLSLDRSTVSNLMRLLELPEPIRQALLEEKLSAGHAKAILPLEEPQQLAMAARIQSEGLSVRKTEEAVRELLQAEPSPDVIPIAGGKARSSRGKPEKTDHIVSLEQRFRDLLGLKVEVRLKSKESGQLIVEFSNNDDFERLSRFLQRAA